MRTKFKYTTWLLLAIAIETAYYKAPSYNRPHYITFKIALLGGTSYIHFPIWPKILLRTNLSRRCIKNMDYYFTKNFSDLLKKSRNLKY